MFYDNALYLEDVQRISELDLPWEKLNNKTILITGSTGMVASFLIDVLMYKNDQGLNCKILAMGRNEEKAKKRFYPFWDNENFSFLSHDINKPIEPDQIPYVDFGIHMASNTHPMAYSLDPIGTITTNLIGAKNLFDFMESYEGSRTAFVSSNEIYGENRGDTDTFSETYCGYVDCNTLRACYTESKRCGEALCQAYIKQKGLDIVIPRLTRSFGPTLLESDTKALTQFLKNGVNREDIVLKSDGKQCYSFTYVPDAVSGLLTVLLKGENGEAYNIAHESLDKTLREAATYISQIAGTEIIYKAPDQVEAAGYSKATKAKLDGSKIRRLGWAPLYSFEDGIQRTISILRDNHWGAQVKNGE